MRKCFLIPKVDFEVSWLKSHLQPGDRVLPLGLAPYTTLQNLLPNVDHLEAWVPFQESRRLAMRAYELNQAFAGEAMRGAVREGYDWPGICINNQDYFFRDILLAEALSLALTQSGMEEVVWVGKPSPVPIVALPTSKAVGRTTQFYLGNRFQVLTPPRSLFSTSCIPYGEKIVNAGRLLRKRILLSEKRKVRECRVVAVFPSTGEWQRFSQPLLELHREFGDGFQLWSLGLAPKSLNEWAASERIPVVWVPYPDREAEGDLRFFEYSLEKMAGGGKVAVGPGIRLSRAGQRSSPISFSLSFHPRMASNGGVCPGVGEVLDQGQTPFSGGIHESDFFPALSLSRGLEAGDSIHSPAPRLRSERETPKSEAPSSLAGTASSVYTLSVPSRRTVRSDCVPMPPMTFLTPVSLSLILFLSGKEW